MKIHRPAPKDTEIKQGIIKKIVFYAAFICILLGTTVLILESGARIYLWLREKKYPVFFEYDKMLGWRHIPGVKGLHKNTDGTNAMISYNKLGFRGRSYDLKKPEGCFRILILGDSFIDAMEIPDHKIMTARLERMLKKKYPGRCWEVVNMGVAGYETDQEFLLLEHEGWKREPDLVVLAFFHINDLSGTKFRVSSGMGKPKPYFVLENDRLNLKGYPVQIVESWGKNNTNKKTEFKGFKSLIRNNLKFYSVTTEIIRKNPAVSKFFIRLNLMVEKSDAWKQMRTLETRPSWMVFLKDYDPWWTEAEEITEKLLMLIKESCLRNRVPLVVITVPGILQLNEKEWDEMVVRKAAARGIPADALDPKKTNRWLKGLFDESEFLDLLPVFIKVSNETNRKLHFDNNLHWNESAQELATKTLLRFLGKHNLLEPEPYRK